MNILLYLIIGIVVGVTIGILISKLRVNVTLQTTKEKNQKLLSDTEKEFAEFKATANAQYQALNDKILVKQEEVEKFYDEISNKTNSLNSIQNELAAVKATLTVAEQSLTEKNTEIINLKEENATTQKDQNIINQALATATANNKALEEKLETQKDEIEKLGKKFNLEFENIANKILETKSEKFTEQNKTNLMNIL